MWLKKFNIIIWIIFILWAGAFGGYNFVFWGFQEFQKLETSWWWSVTARFVSDLWRTVYLDDDNLRGLLVLFRWSDDIKNYQIHSVCNIHSEYKFSYQDIHFFYLEYLDTHCNNSTIALKNWDIIVSRSLWNITFSSKAEELSILLDIDDARLANYDARLANQLRWVGVFRNYNNDISLTNLPKHFRKYQALELLYKRHLVAKIQNGRRQKYISPVPGYFIQKQANKVPNAWRPYRSWYTDGIHHGWDIDAPIGTPVVALDDGIIVRIKNGFTSQNFKNIRYGDNLSYEQQLKNLDILRGNQVWHKTLKWEVIFYSHLQDISSDIQDGMFIKAWTYIGTVGITWIPGSGYEDFHLHFDVKIPPFTLWREGTYTLLEYMKWPWSWKWQSQDEVYALIDNMFKR